MPRSDTVLIVNPEFDVATSFTHLWTNEVIGDAQQLGLNVVILDRDEARLPQFESAISNSNPLLIYAQGHGSPEILTAAEQSDLLWTKTDYSGHEHDTANIHLVSGRINYMLSCLTGRALGPAIAAQPNTYYIGYTEDFIFAGWDPGDVYSESFKLATNEIAKTLLRGKSIGEAYNAGIAKFDEEIAKWQQSNDPSAPFIVSALLHDRDALIIYPGMPAPPPEVPVEGPWAGMLTAGYGVIISLALI